MSHTDNPTFDGEMEVSVLSAAYAVYKLTCENPVSPDEFREIYMKHGPVFRDLVFGSTTCQ